MMVNATGGVCPVADVTQHLRITPPKAGASLLWPGGRYFGQRDSPVGTSVADLGLSEGTYFSGGAEERLAVGGAALRLGSGGDPQVKSRGRPGNIEIRLEATML